MKVTVFHFIFPKMSSVTSKTITPITRKCVRMVFRSFKVSVLTVLDNISA